MSQHNTPEPLFPATLPFAITDQEMKDLMRFHECAMDDEGYDVPKERMKRLAEIGLIRRVTSNFYEHTTFGLSIINGDFKQKSDSERQRDALLAALEELSLYVAYNGDDWVQRKARAAIANVKGQPCQECGSNDTGRAHEEDCAAGDGWIEWKGGECPVGPHEIVAVKLQGGYCFTRTAGKFRWSHDEFCLSPIDIIAYRVVHGCGAA